MSHISPEDGVPSLSPADRLVLLRGRGKCKAIKDIELVEEREGKWKRKWSVISDTEDESDDGADEFIQIVPKLAKRTTPNRKAKVLTPTAKKISLPRTKYVEREAQWECSPVSPVPPVRGQAERSSLASQKSKQVKTNVSHLMKTTEKLGVSDSKVADDKLKDNDSEEITEESDLCQPSSGMTEQHDGIATEVVKVDNNNKAHSNEEKEKLVPPVSKLDAAFLPAGYGADKLAQVLICLLEEKVRVSSSHSERELFRKTIHVLLCGGCTDREKHNKVRCKRCDDRDKRKMEDKKGKKSDKSDKSDLSIRIDKHLGKSKDKADRKETEKKITIKKTDLSIRIDNQLAKSIDRVDRKETEKKDTMQKTNPKMKGRKESSKTDEPSKTNLQSTKSKDIFVLSGVDASGIAKCPEFVNINEDLGKIDRDAIFSDASDEHMEGLGSVEEFVLSTDESQAVHVELIHDDEINTELAIAKYICDTVGECGLDVNDQVAGDTTDHRETVMKGGNMVDVEQK